MTQNQNHHSPCLQVGRSKSVPAGSHLVRSLDFQCLQNHQILQLKQLLGCMSNDGEGETCTPSSTDELEQKVEALELKVQCLEELKPIVTSLQETVAELEQKVADLEAGSGGTGVDPSRVEALEQKLDNLEPLVDCNTQQTLGYVFPATMPQD